VGAHERGKVGGVTRLDQTDGARRVIIQRGIDHDDTVISLQPT
jgi:hypothetical protein